MDISNLGKWTFFAGAGVAALGLLVWLFGKSRLPFGKLPGDIRIERDGFSFYFPVASAIILSIVLTVVINVLVRLFRK